MIPHVRCCLWRLEEEVASPGAELQTDVGRRGRAGNGT